MSQDRSRSQHQAIALPDAAMSLWTAQTSASEAGPAAGTPVPTASSRLALTASGAQTAAIDVRVQDGGVPTLDVTDTDYQVLQAARMLWRRDGASDWYGWDPPGTLSRWEAIEQATTTPEYTRNPDIAVTESGVALIVVDLRDSGETDEYILACYRRATSGTWSRVVIDDQAFAPSQRRQPAIVVLPSGRVQVYEWIASGVGSRRYLRMWYSDDDGASWSHGGDKVIDDPPRVTVERTRVAYNSGQVLLLVGLNDAGTQSVWQYASSDLGLTFQNVVKVAGVGGAGLADCAPAYGGGFCVVAAEVEAASGAQAYRLADAYAPFDNETARTLGLSISASPGGLDASSDDLAVVADETGILYAYGRIDSTLYASVSYDGGRTWEEFLDELFVANFPTTDEYLATFSCAMHRGRVIMAHRFIAGTASWSADLGAGYFGGWTTATMPSANITMSESLMLGWRFVYLPIELPGNAGWTAAGAGSETLGTSGFLTVTTGAGQTRTFTRSAGTDDIGLRVVVQPTNATLGDQRVQVSNGTQQVSIRLASGSWELWDDLAGAQIGVAAAGTWSLGLEVWIELDKSGDAIQSWYREDSTSEESDWIAGPQSSSLATGTPTAQIVWGHTVAHAQSSVWREIAYDDGASRRAFRAVPQSFPASLRGRPMAGVPYLGAGVRLRARGGPAWRGEEWNIPTRPQYRLENATEIVSPRIGWRSTDLTTQRIALQWDDEGGRGASTVLALILRGTNIGRVQIDRRDPGAWQPIGTVDLGVTDITADRTGRSVRPGGSGAASPYLYHGEYAGGTLVLDVGGGSEEAFRIASHTEGRWDEAYPLQPTIRLSGDVAGAPSSDVAAQIIPEQIVILIRTDGLTVEGIRLSTVAATPTPAEGYYEIGSLHAMWVHPLGTEYAWGRSITTEAQVEDVRTRDGQRRTVVTGPPRRSVEVEWSDGILQDEIEHAEASPGWVRLGSTVEPGAAEVGTALALEGMSRQIDGSDQAVAYLPAIPAMGADRVHVLHRRRDCLVGRMSPAITRSVVLGAEHRDEVVQVSTVSIEEEV